MAEGSGSGGSSGGAPADAQYIVLADDAGLSAEEVHANLSADADLHDPKAHDHTGEALTPDSISTGQANIDELRYEIESSTNIASNRTIGTEHQNNTGNTLELSISLEHTSDNLDFGIILMVGPTSGLTQPEDNKAKYEVQSVTSNHRWGTTVIVPPEHYYKVINYNDKPAVDSWVERELTPP